MRLPRLQRYDARDLETLPYDEKVRAIEEMGLRCVLRSTAVSRGRISDGMVVFDEGRPVASYFEEDGERLFGEKALSRISSLSGKKKAVSDVFVLTPIQLKMVLREDERLLLKKGKRPPRPRPPRARAAAPPAVASRPQKKAELISKITDISRRARREKEKKRSPPAPETAPAPVPAREAKPDTYGLLEVPQEFILEKAMESRRGATGNSPSGRCRNSAR
ncbi:MAG: hypothetical protein GXO65_07465 [Euryarchaeota archaeon]|nr:hypothetical protein [Euryarchaeota archaeon]